MIVLSPVNKNPPPLMLVNDWTINIVENIPKDGVCNLPNLLNNNQEDPATDYSAQKSAIFD